ncbi:hypothetical protein PQ469_26445 [Mucilaginibacter sp. KACC 22773]|jgi:hypothetical protein|uniref:hypothetical protein n=1 Tax=Mucilaginibacter sp. KACC 22773 TaxID=3025671 RepID=UPI002365F2DB|nr:hypothetical protein [Mucilaginibacter sp. KACC 22773]WDF77429.1 hypothetical protein PQ469_26445 [Mucilaginibacter sp. KACC 22773]
MPFTWLLQDNAAAVTAGLNGGLTYAGVIQANDGLGGYNTNFGVTEAGHGHYHVHFLAGTQQVSCIRYFAPGVANGQGTNILTGTSPSSTMNALLRGLSADYPNHRALITNFINALQNVVVAANGQYS